MWRIVLALLLFAGSAYSEPPSPAPTKTDQQKKGETSNAQDSSKQDLRGTHEKPLIVDVLPAPDAEQIAKRKTEQEEEKSTLDRWLTGASVSLAVITFFLALYTARLWRETHRLAEDARNTAVKQATDMKKSLSIAQQSADAALLSVKNMQSADRAYIKMSHFPPGLIFNDALAERIYGEVRTGDVRIEVINLGKTPAIITSVAMTYFTLPLSEPLPPLPLYHMGRPEETKMKTILYGTDAITPPPTFKLTLSAEEFTSINEKTSRLYLLLYADYIDQFGIRHRAGYARRYDPQSTNNLTLVTQRDYNYDIQRQPGQGDDWNEPQA